jgi:predicted transposase YdaD
MPTNDNAFKVMLHYHPEQFVARFLPGAEYVETLATELPRESLFADALLRVRYRGELYILHIEVQSGADAKIPERLLQYMVLIWLREQTKVLSVVIYLSKTKTPTSPWQLEGPGGPINTFHFQVVKLWEEPVDEWLASGQVGLLIFTPLLKGATLDTVATAAAII